MKHSPAPWAVLKSSGTYLIQDRNAQSIAEIAGSTKTAQANARLVAASSDLLSMLVEIGLTLKHGNSIIPNRDKVVLAKIEALVKSIIE